jgi:hypothetical protein
LMASSGLANWADAGAATASAAAARVRDAMIFMFVLLRGLKTVVLHQFDCDFSLGLAKSIFSNFLA